MCAFNTGFSGWCGNNWRIKEDNMFQGFNEFTIRYYKAICKDNCKKLIKIMNSYILKGCVLQELLERKRVSYTHEENLSAVFYEREILIYIFRHLTV